LPDNPRGEGGTKRDAASLTDHIEQNVENVVALQRQEWERTSLSQRRVERVSIIIGRPAFLIALLVLVALWVTANLRAAALGFHAFDPWPFPVLDGLLSLIALIVTTIVLIAQNRQSKLEQQHTHLGLQVNLLTEQKVTHLIHLLEELRQDLPMVRNRHDVQTDILKNTADTSEVISAIKESRKAGPAEGGEQK
jgi:uncharacterized membrane protein